MGGVGWRTSKRLWIWDGYWRSQEIGQRESRWAKCMKKGSQRARWRLRDVSRKAECETKIARKEKENKRERISGIVLVCASILPLCCSVWSERAERAPEGLELGWLRSQSPAPSWLSASSLSLSCSLPSSGAADDTHPSFSFSSSSENRIIARYTDTHTHTHTHTAQSWNQIQCYEHQQ